MGSIFQSLGLKRLIASALSVIVEVLRAIPGTAEAIAAVEMIAGFFGITGLSHAAVSGNLSRKIIATASAAVASLIGLSYFVPALAQFRPILEKVAAILGAAALGAHVKEVEVVNKDEMTEHKDIDTI